MKNYFFLTRANIWLILLAISRANICTPFGSMQFHGLNKGKKIKSSLRLNFIVPNKILFRADPLDQESNTA